ncbi:Ras-related protein Rab-10 [Geodia barretti]|uniref:Ras-related protein Rab-10 n=1 Tax=Geodia barretti TaxID=519541 RepID=A0AA35RL30_GEOBA|nr:Ras-related protein Rab-10 [Geodia barretti]
MADLGKDQQAEPSEVVPKEKYDLLFKLLLVGDSGVGKSSVIRRYSNDAFTTPSISPIGADFTIKTIEMEGKRIQLQIWDTPAFDR